VLEGVGRRWEALKVLRGLAGCYEVKLRVARF
jgi:hypothetical protein